jgi:mitochondrial transcription factor 1
LNFARSHGHKFNLPAALDAFVLLSQHAMSFPFTLRRAFSTSIRCSYKTKNIPEDILASTLNTQPRKRGRPKNIQGVGEITPKAEPRSPSTSKVDRRRRAKNKLSLPADRLELPPLLQWLDYFPTGGMALKGRISIANPDTAALVADSFVPHGSRDKVIVEAYPGEDTDIINSIC